MFLISVNYSKLRATSESVMRFVKDEYWWDKNSNLGTRLENDLGITGDDAVELMQKFSKKFNVDISDFNFQKFFSSEGNYYSFILIIPAIGITFLAGILKYTLITLVYLFSDRIYNWLKQYRARSIYEAAGKNIEPSDNDFLTVADLITSAITGKFIQRKEVRIVLSPTKIL